jgi:hypothetical protein
MPATWPDLGQEAPMRVVSGIEGSAGGAAASAHREDDDAALAPIPSARALIAIAAAPVQAHTTDASQRAHAPFLAHLIATAQQAPQMRARRRAAPDAVMTAYATGLKVSRRSPAGRLLRSVA